MRCSCGINELHLTEAVKRKPGEYMHQPPTHLHGIRCGNSYWQPHHTLFILSLHFREDLPGCQWGGWSSCKDWWKISRIHQFLTNVSQRAKKNNIGTHRSPTRNTTFSCNTTVQFKTADRVGGVQRLRWGWGDGGSSSSRLAGLHAFRPEILRRE